MIYTKVQKTFWAVDENCQIRPKRLQEREEEDNPQVVSKWRHKRGITHFSVVFATDTINGNRLDEWKWEAVMWNCCELFFEDIETEMDTKCEQSIRIYQDSVNGSLFNLFYWCSNCWKLQAKEQPRKDCIDSPDLWAWQNRCVNFHFRYSSAVWWAC